MVLGFCRRNQVVAHWSTTGFLARRLPASIPPVHPELRNLCIPSLLDAVISESLHVHPPVESIGNLSITEIPLPDGTIVQPGEEVLISAWTSSDNSSHASCSTGGHHLNCEEGSADRTTNEGLD